MADCPPPFFATAPVSDVSLVANATEMIEFHSAVHISCTAGGSNVTLKLYSRNTNVSGTGLSTIGQTIYNVTRQDRGPYVCEASNAVNGVVVRTLTLNIICEWKIRERQIWIMLSEK